MGETVLSSMLFTSLRSMETCWEGSERSVLMFTRSPLRFTTTPLKVSPLFFVTITGANCSLITLLGLMIWSRKSCGL